MDPAVGRDTWGFGDGVGNGIFFWEMGYMDGTVLQAVDRSGISLVLPFIPQFKQLYRIHIGSVLRQK